MAHEKQLYTKLQYKMPQKAIVGVGYLRTISTTSISY